MLTGALETTPQRTDTHSLAATLGEKQRAYQQAGVGRASLASANQQGEKGAGFEADLGVARKRRRVDRDGRLPRLEEGSESGHVPEGFAADVIRFAKGFAFQ